MVSMTRSIKQDILILSDQFTINVFQIHSININLREKTELFYYATIIFNNTKAYLDFW